MVVRPRAWAAAVATWPAEGGDGGVAAGVDGVGEEDDVGVGGGVEPEAGAGEAGVAEAAGVAAVRGDGEDFAAGAGEGGVEVPAEGSLGYALGGVLVLGEDGGVACGGGGGLRAVASWRVDCLRGKGPVLWLSLVEQGLAEARQSCGGGEEAGVSGDSAHAAGGGVVDGAAEEVVVVGVGGGGAFVVVGGGGGVGDRLRGQTRCRRGSDADASDGRRAGFDGGAGTEGARPQVLLNGVIGGGAACRGDRRCGRGRRRSRVGPERFRRGSRG